MYTDIDAVIHIKDKWNLTAQAISPIVSMENEAHSVVTGVMGYNPDYDDLVFLIFLYC